MKCAEIKNGILYLDGVKVPCVKNFNLAKSTKVKGIAELTICMDVLISQEEQIESK